MGILTVALGNQVQITKSWVIIRKNVIITIFLTNQERTERITRVVG